MLGFFLEHDDEAIVYGVIPSRHLRDIAHRPGCPRVWVASNNAVILRGDATLLQKVYDKEKLSAHTNASGDYTHIAARTHHVANCVNNSMRRDLISKL